MSSKLGIIKKVSVDGSSLIPFLFFKGSIGMKLKLDCQHMYKKLITSKVIGLYVDIKLDK